MWNNLTVKGFHFNTSAEYVQAKHEAETIDYICSRMDISKPEIALKVYYKLLDRQTLHTIVGICFLKQLRDSILSSNIIDEEELKILHAPILTEPEETTDFGDETALENSSIASDFANDTAEEEDTDNSQPETLDDASESTKFTSSSTDIKTLCRDLENSKAREKKLNNLLEYNKSKIKKLYVVIFALIAIIGTLFGIAMYNNNLTFVNEEIAVQNKYAQWQEELEAKEAELAARENALK